MEKIHVSVRSRPLSREDATKSPWKISSDSSIFIPNQSPSFRFDRIFREDCKTTEVYETRTKEIVAAAIRGFNGTVFAYGQTNSGKTHTMRGSQTEPGVIPLAVHDLFNTVSQDASRDFLLRMSYLEIYNEDIHDLLAPQHRKLQIHENLEKGIFVAGLREEIVSSPQQVLELMEFGQSHRHIGETNMNAHSSRSHTIFRMIIESSHKTQDEGVGNACDAVRVSVLNLVDLAGSERASKTGAEGVRLKEGSHINKSLMTLGTVIKKLSEGVENRGGHVPYRDSKLTRILQPALGGNANTAIICNITLAPIHAEETKITLQFASRALRVTNCAHVNEISTDAALLKRQKKKIEELRSRPKTSHSDHSDGDILKLRNTLLKSEIEREQIAMELDEERKAQAQREKVLQEQAKKIENLSSIVLFSNRDEKRERDYFKKGKRRDTWGTSHLSRDSSTSEVQSHVLSKGSSLKSERSERETGTELLKNERLCSISEQDENIIDDTLEDSALPDPCALVHVTRRKKPSSIRQKSPVVIESEQREYEALFLQYEAEISMLETEKSSSKKNLDELIRIATVQNTCAREKNAEIEEEIHAAREEAQIAREQLMSKESEVNHVLKGSFNSLVNVATEVEILASEFQKFKASLETVSLVMDEGLQNFDFFSPLIHDFTLNMRQSFEQQASVIRSYQNVQSCLKQKVVDIENEKCAGLQSQIEELSQEAQKHGTSLMVFQFPSNGIYWSPFIPPTFQCRNVIWLFKPFCQMLSEHHESEKSNLLSHIESLEKNLASMSTFSEKTKKKLKHTESKLENAMHDKTKLEMLSKHHESEKSDLLYHIDFLEKKIAKLSTSSEKTKTKLNHTESKLQNAVNDKTKLQEDFYNLETRFASLEEELAAEREEKEKAIWIATVQNTCAREKNAEIEEEIHAAREEAQIAREQLMSKESEVNHVLKENFNSLVNVATEVEVLGSEFQKFKASLETISLVMDEGLQDFDFFSPLIHDFTLNMRQSFEQQASVISSYQNVQSCLKQKVVDIENEKCAGLQSQIEELSQEAQKHLKKLNDTESKLQNAVNDKTKLQVCGGIQF
ncbi:Kinesin motor domain-containing protein [Hirschfeldia incana]|nr:Kinesin motor domain-containing protein [Hirschfeldia incana]